MRIGTLHALALSAGVLLVAAGARCAGAQHPQVMDQFIVSPAWLAQHLHDANTVVLAVEHDPDTFAEAHIPGARMVTYADFAVDRDGNGSELPPIDVLRDVFRKAGVSNGSHVIVYSSMAPMASRAFYTLDYAGGVQVSFLDGGLAAWKAAGHPIASGATAVAMGTYVPRPRPQAVVDAAWVQAHAGKPGVALIDTRTDGEYLGSGDRHGLPSDGHILGARQLQWQQLFSDPNTSALLPRDSLARLYAARVPAGDTVVTYCLVGYRASMTYMVARALGYPVRLYDGSYEDWSRRKLSLVVGASAR